MVALYAYRELIRNLVLKDLKLKYRDSALGFLWSLANPLLLIAVFSFVFGHILRGGPTNFAYFLMIGILPWNFFAQSLTMSTGSVLENGSLIRKVAVPMEVFPVSTVLFNLAQYLLALAVFFPAALLFLRVPPSWSWLAFVPILLLQAVFTLGVCLIASTATVFYRDVRHFAEILLTLLFWLTPIVYDVRAVPPSMVTIIHLNPMTYVVLAYQDVLYHSVFPPAERLAAVVVLSLSALAIGVAVFEGQKRRFAEEV
jgi:ABC-2 type transport system permease protein